MSDTASGRYYRSDFTVALLVFGGIMCAVPVGLALSVVSVAGAQDAEYLIRRIMPLFVVLLGYGALGAGLGLVRWFAPRIGIRLSLLVVPVLLPFAPLGTALGVWYFASIKGSEKRPDGAENADMK